MIENNLNGKSLFDRNQINLVCQRMQFMRIYTFI